MVFYVFLFFPFSNGNLRLGCGQFRQGGIKSGAQTSPLVIIGKVRMDVLLGMQALQPRHTPAYNPTATFIQFTWKVICVQHNTVACLSAVLDGNIHPFFDFKFPFRFRVFPGILYSVIHPFLCHNQFCLIADCLACHALCATMTSCRSCSSNASVSGV